jgi:DNA-binding winged helix-turn-helix (wHTH) protein/tetratricopeptide (TPR) repeat protein
MATSRQYVFGEFRLDATQRALFRRNDLVPLTPKALETLLFLVERHGQIVDKKDLMDAIWPDTFVEEVSLARNVSVLRKMLSENEDGQPYIETIPKRGYRFVASIEELDRIPKDIPARTAEKHIAPATPLVKPFPWAMAAPAALVVAALATGAYLLFHPRPVLSEMDTVVLADLTNTTGDPVFDGTLRQGLAIQLAQSPFLSIVSKDRMRRTLALMGEPVDVRLGPKIARELCLRTGSKVVLEGSITAVGSHYSVILNADRCSNGESMASSGAQASDKQHVLEALGRVASEMRTKLGESLTSVQKYDASIEQATTASLEALQAYGLGRRIMDLKGDYAAAVPMFQGAIRLDPHFAMAYAALGTSYYALEESTRSGENLKRAYELRGQVSEREKFEIEALYHWFATGDLEKAAKVYELWAQTYPRDDVPPNNLGVLYQELGRNEETLEQARECFRLDPESGLSYANLADSYLHVNKLKEARATAEEALAKNLESPHLHFYLHRIAFLQNEPERMAREVAWAKGKSGAEELLLESQVHVEAYYGHLKNAHSLLEQVEAASLRSGDKEAAATYRTTLALSEADLGMQERARQEVRAALAMASTRDMQALAAVVLARVGDAAQAEKTADEFAREYPIDTNISKVWLPTVRAILDMRQKKPEKAIEELKSVSPYELGSDDNLYSVYLRGLAYLMLRQGTEAEREFQKVLDHRPIYQKNERAALAQVGLARAYKLEGNLQKARSSYEEFLKLWQTADPDIPILAAAKAEYAHLN